MSDGTAEFYQALTRPETVAIVGATDNPGRVPSRPVEYLLSAGWDGQVLPVNPRRTSVYGLTCWPSLSELPVRPDHVFVVAGREIAAAAVTEAASLGVPLVTLLADGFAGDSREASAARSSMLTALRSSPTRLLGPSSLGVASMHARMLLTGNAAFQDVSFEPGGLFVASQSGSVMGALKSRGDAMGIGFHTLVSTGTELDLTLGEICRASLDDPAVHAYALFAENLNAVGDLRDFAVEAHRRKKPVTVYKLGRTAAAADLSVSHTGALAGDDAVASALYADLGVGRVYHFEALLESHGLATALDRNRPGPGGVVVCSTTGGGGAMMVDCLANLGVPFAQLGQATLAQLGELGVHDVTGPLVDLTLAGANAKTVRRALDILGEDPGVRLIVAVPGSSARFQPELTVEPLVEAASAGISLCAFVMPEAPEALRRLRAGGVAAFRTPEACADAIRGRFSLRGAKARPQRRRPEAVGATVLDESASYGVLARVGVPHAPFVRAQPGEELDRLPFPGPYVVKVLAENLPHKSDAGGVIVGVADLEGVNKSAASLAARFAGRQIQVLIQPMIKSLMEVLVGYRLDPNAGPMILLAAGGLGAELLDDRSVRLAPVDIDEAREMIAEVRSLELASGFRNAPQGDLESLARAIVSLSQLADYPAPVIEAEVNPLMILPEGEGVLAVDAVVRIGHDATEGKSDG